MTKATLYRDMFLPEATLGSLMVGGIWFRTIERPWLNNCSNVSCIPEGVYRADYVERSGSGKYRKVWWLRAVPGRSGVLVHSGNLASHSRGCIILGSRRGFLRGQPAVLGSKTAMAALYDLVGPNGLRIEIQNAAQLPEVA